MDNEPLPELLRLLKWYRRKQADIDIFLMGCKIVDHVRDLQRQARMEEHREMDGMLIKLLRRLGGYYDHIEPSDKADTLQRTYQYVQELERLSRLDEHKILAALDEEGRKQRYLELLGTEGPHGSL